MARLHALAPGLWTLDGDPIRFLGLPYALRSTLVRLADGELLVHSPVQLEVARDTVASIGRPAHIVTPNKLHHLFLADWARAWPTARLHAPPGLARKRPDLEFASELGDHADPAWSDVLDQRVVRGSLFMDEVLFFHRASRTLLLGDLIENHDPALLGRFARAVARANAMLAPHGSTPRDYRLSFVRRAAAQRTILEVLSWSPQRVVMMHGPIVEQQAERFLREAFAWLLRPRAAAPRDPR